MTTRPPNCDWFWGSHGCDMPGGHEGTIHTCGSRDEEGPCSQYDTAAPPDKRVRWEHGDNPDGTTQWGDWGPYGEGFGMGRGWGAPSITPPHVHADPPTSVCPACTTHPQPAPQTDEIGHEAAPEQANPPA